MYCILPEIEADNKCGKERGIGLDLWWPKSGSVETETTVGIISQGSEVGRG